MSDEKEKDKEKQPDGENSGTADLIKELGMLARDTGSGKRTCGNSS